VFEKRIQNSAETYEAEILDMQAWTQKYTWRCTHTHTHTHKLSHIPNDQLELAWLNRRKNERNINKGCPNKSVRFNFVINASFIQKVLIFLFQYKVHILQLIVENNIPEMSPSTLLSRGGWQCARFKSCILVGTPHIIEFNYTKGC
jgi:hypothetical protein